MKFKAPLAVALVVIVLCTVVQGVYTYRWTNYQSSDDLKDMAERLGRVPNEIGGWQGSEVETDERVERVAGIEGSVNRVYTNSAGETATIALVCGDRRNMTTHTPERCFKASGWTMGASGSTTYPVPISGSKDNESSDNVDFMTATFRKDDATEGMQLTQVFWAWNADGEWIAPSSDPRFPEWLGGLPESKSWYKLYILSERPTVGGRQIDVGDTSAYKFARVLLPLLSDTLFQDSPNPSQ